MTEKFSIENVDFEELKKLRSEIHSHPCVSGCEEDTAKRITEYLRKFNPKNLYTGIGGNGVIAEFEVCGGAVGDGCCKCSDSGSGCCKSGNVLIRAELDALPIGHRCGHDGHMAILCGVAQWLSAVQEMYRAKCSDKVDCKSVYLLFQPAEEIGTGAKAMVEDIAAFNTSHLEHPIEYEWVFALHNWPGFKENSVILFPNCYAWGSTGMKITFKGAPAHASEPENSARIAEIISNFVLAVSYLNGESAFSTCIGIKMGEENFGTAPGEGAVCLTVRGANEELLNSLVEQIKVASEMVVVKVAEGKKVETAISFCDEFPPTMNCAEANALVEKAAKELGLEIGVNEIGDRGSDDFCWFASGKKSAFFNLGAGENLPPIHSPEFEFNDNLIKTGVSLFAGILSNFVETTK